MDKQTIYRGTILFTAAILAVLILFSATSCGRSPAPDGTGESQTSSQGGESTQEGISAPQSHGEHAIGSLSGDTDPLTLYQEEENTIMTDMMANMSVEPTGNASINFLKGMIPHHEAAIEMAESYLKYGGSNSELKQLAEDIIQVQTDEIEQMNEMIEQINASGEADEEKEQGYLDAYGAMMSDHSHMNHAASSAKDVEEAFAQGMIMHHQMAVEMAEAILNYTDENEVKDLAEDIIEAQKREIKQMEEILNQE